LVSHPYLLYLLYNVVLLNNVNPLTISICTGFHIHKSIIPLNLNNNPSKYLTKIFIKIDEIYNNDLALYATVNQYSHAGQLLESGFFQKDYV
jgi:hypothetical protein